ncbi:ClpXP protease specificity-enhancing factor / Stringent starvation protein B [Paraburkholderia unamae]|uniref:ClpXP protease specificity-enhancing factor n=1 Tax=Paraburkholderia unamae TaxID=219649 RepID=UPI001CB3775A|nr:ClpXP protease specificity-enhancing factor [Paraburkholderia unamae]CAG9272031.1 ClpXP protease specificity-enhancing factor / Stringent starvation protein B [Paraburkholderia unamae]
MQEISTKPYLLRALYEWCTDNGFTPHIAVRVDNSTRVPRQFVRDGEIVLNISFEATSQLQMGNEMIEFHARFSGKSHKIEVPVANVLAIYARENGQGMAFPVESPPGDADDVLSSEDHEDSDTGAHEAHELRDEPVEAPAAPVAPRAVQKDERDDDGGNKGGKGHLKIVK